MLVSDFDHQFGPQRFPRQIFSLAPTALAARHALAGLPLSRFRPLFPRVMGEGILAIGRQELKKFLALLVREACANADMLQGAGVVEKPEQQRADIRAVAFLVPSESRYDAIAIPLVFDLEHHALVRLIGPCLRLCDHAVDRWSMACNFGRPARFTIAFRHQPAASARMISASRNRAAR